MGKLKKIRFPAPLFVAMMVLLIELMIHIWVAGEILPGRLLAVAVFGLGLGCLLGFITSLIPLKGQKWFAGVVTFLVLAFYLAEYFMNDAYQSFMSPASILNSAGNVATDFSSVIVSMLLRNLWRIGLMLLPIVLYLVFTKPVKCCWKVRTIFGAGCLTLFMLGFCVVQWVAVDAPVMAESYNFDSAVRCFGMSPAMTLELTRDSAEEEEQDFVIAETVAPVETAPPATEAPVETETPEETVPPTEPPKVYGYHAFDLDYEALAVAEKSGSVAKVHRYVNSLTPSMENDFTGLFEGKNLILITAEAFSAEVIDPELTPTLYRLANEGFRFTDYYQPLWGGSTSTGEYSNLTGLVAHNGTASMKEAYQQDMFLTIGNQLRKLGYFSAAYHNHSYTYYDRYQTHTDIGYDTFTGMRNGMEKGVKDCWPESDLEMMEFTVEQYIDQQPFSIYYMTVSGHCLYSTTGNSMSNKNWDAVSHLDATSTIKSYYACQLELEYAMTYLVNALEEAGIADDTVIVLATDHYPYGLERSSTWNNTQDYLSQLYGYKYANCIERDHNALIIWSGCVEDMDIVVDDPVYSLDILPTLSNLFGVEYDSRLLVGRDVFSDEEAIALWPNYCWKTNLGTYDATKKKFYPVEGVEIPEGYVDRISTIVANKITYSKSVGNLDYYNYVSKALKAQE